jgi:4-amino-4-deoxy-L-arabinose transferase-like glycosyltransferase
VSLKNASKKTRRMTERQARFALIAVACLALAARLWWVLVAVPSPDIAGGDGPFYLRMGRVILEHGLTTAITWMGTSGPLYPLGFAFLYTVLPNDDQTILQAARIAQTMIDTLTCCAAFDLGRRVFNERAGLLAGLAVALDLRFITQAGAINTETFFIFFLVTGVRAFVIARAATDDRRKWPGYVLSNILFLLASFTRAIAIGLPVLFAGLTLLPKPTPAQLKRAALVVGVGALIISGLTAWTYATTGRIVVISSGLDIQFWMGSRLDGQWHGAEAFEQERAYLIAEDPENPPYLRDAFQTIARDPVAYVLLQFRKLAAAYLQPHGTTAFAGESLKDLAVAALRGQISVVELINGEAFWPKLIIYIFHYVSLIGGLIGLWLARRDWLKVLPLALPIFYFTAAYTPLVIIPRYVFPAMPFFMILAAFAGVTLFSRRAGRIEPMHNS